MDGWTLYGHHVTSLSSLHIAKKEFYGKDHHRCVGDPLGSTAWTRLYCAKHACNSTPATQLCFVKDRPITLMELKD
jgi:hypothetical protein